ncbi:hypothetical protein [Candidatus Tokpelaia sp.]|uniref:hypothetical protein n=1 Tax=Candidatus Tokpelaia sp. TaxID=2233777 RepID=UPI00123BE4CB|nr:hypothetical protein [Candidatus Tokpelaia sp.]KAA6405695.1 hypothetical protein DPQ22_03295 [Candidatus Tokpelaia sp.]
MKKSQKGDLAAVYVTKNARNLAGRLQKDRGKLVGFYEISHKKTGLKDCISPVEQELFKDEIKREKWKDCLKATRAWEIIAEDRKAVEHILPATYSPENARLIDSIAPKLTDTETRNLLALRVIERKVYDKNYDTAGSLHSQKQADQAKAPHADYKSPAAITR